MRTLLEKPAVVSKYTGLSGNCRVLLPRTALLKPADEDEEESVDPKNLAAVLEESKREEDDFRYMDENVDIREKDLYLFDILSVADKFKWSYLEEERFDATLKAIVGSMREEGVNLDLFTIYCFRLTDLTGRVSIFLSGGQRRYLSFVFSVFSDPSKQV